MLFPSSSFLPSLSGKSFREQQCEKYNSPHYLDFNGHMKQWIPKYAGVSPRDRCKLFCITRDSSEFKVFQTKVCLLCGPACYRHGNNTDYAGRAGQMEAGWLVSFRMRWVCIPTVSINRSIWLQLWSYRVSHVVLLWLLLNKKSPLWKPTIFQHVCYVDRWLTAPPVALTPPRCVSKASVWRLVVTSWLDPTRSSISAECAERPPHTSSPAWRSQVPTAKPGKHYGWYSPACVVKMYVYVCKLGCHVNILTWWQHTYKESVYRMVSRNQLKSVAVSQ